MALLPFQRLLLPLAFAASLCPAQQNLDDVVERVRKSFEVPGIAVGIVRDGKLTFAKGYGVRKLGDPAPVTPKTLYGIASNTKAFTAAALAILVDDGKLSWDDRVIDKLPAFQMADPYISRELTIRDLLVHHSGLGLGAGDLMIFPDSDLTREQIMARIRYIPIATSFRSHYEYDNILYLVAGEVIRAVSGMEWDQFIRERIFKPVGMTQSKTSAGLIRAEDDAAYPHAKDGETLRVVGRSSFEQDAAAGAIQSNLEDMAKWVTAQLERGALPDGKRLFSEKQSAEMWTPVTVIPFGDPPKPLAGLKPMYLSYGLGWVLSDYHGHKMVHHTGGLSGMVTRVTLIPDLKLAVIVLTNQEQGAAFNAITYTALDQQMGLPATDWVAAYEQVTAERKAEAQKTVGAAAAKRNAASQPSLPLKSYAGRYRDPWYGDVVIEEQAGKLVMRFSHTKALTGDIEHWQYDTFVVRWRDRTLDADAYVTFALKADGGIESVKMAAVSPTTDFSFDFHHLLLKPVAADVPAYD
jgi:CubicO group peptidase (beta-lactamase class C family)